MIAGVVAMYRTGYGLKNIFHAVRHFARIADASDVWIAMPLVLFSVMRYGNAIRRISRGVMAPKGRADLSEEIL